MTITSELLCYRISVLMNHAMSLQPEAERTPYKQAELQDWIIDWLPQPLFGQGGRTPLQAIRTEEGLQEMMTALDRMVYGVYS